MRLGLDIGGTKTAAALVHDDGRLAVLRTTPSGHGPDAVVEVAASLAREVMASAGPGEKRPPSVGACMPGIVDPATGIVRHAVNLGVGQLDLAGRLGDRLGHPVAVDNDVKAAALGASHLLSSRDSDGSASRTWKDRTLAYLNIGTGLAAALVRDGVVLRGADGSLGEIGHLPMGGDAWCGCGQRGCLETLVSGSALARMWPSARQSGQSPFDAASKGDSQAASACAQLCSGLFLALQMLVLTTGADRIVIGGGLTSLGEHLDAGLHDEIGRRADASDFVASLELAGRVELLPADLPVAALGAALLPTIALAVPRPPARPSGVPA